MKYGEEKNGAPSSEEKAEERDKNKRLHILNFELWRRKKTVQMHDDTHHH